MPPRTSRLFDPEARGISRRAFLKYCGAVAVALGMEASMAGSIARALTSAKPQVVWLNFSECTGCSESLLRSEGPNVESIIFDVLNLNYHETIMAAAGARATELLEATAAQYAGQFICVVEGSIPTAQNGVFGTIGGKTMLSIAQSIIPKAKYVISFGTCSSYGGLAAAAPNPTGAKGVSAALGLSNVINIPGCPPNPFNLVSTLANYLVAGQMPALDSKGRPTFAYGQTVHAQCPKPYGCLEGYNCKGKTTYGNCPTQKFNGESWCVQVEHQCIGCTEPNFWDANAPFYNTMWASMFATYRKDAQAHPLNNAAFCTPCHSSSTYATRKQQYGSTFATRMHSEHEMTSRLNTNVGCANCHTAPGGTKIEIDD
jgi:[NiFe] hydrogenase small subunit